MNVFLLVVQIAFGLFAGTFGWRKYSRTMRAARTDPRAIDGYLPATLICFAGGYLIALLGVLFAVAQSQV